MRGSCLCADVTFVVSGGPTDVGYCHCSQCRKQSGHFWASATIPLAQINITGAVRWFASSDFAKRGFCPKCGSFLFWKHNDEDALGFSLGAVDGLTGLHPVKHIFVADKGDYYDIADGLPQEEAELL